MKSPKDTRSETARGAAREKAGTATGYRRPQVHDLGKLDRLQGAVFGAYLDARGYFWTSPGGLVLGQRGRVPLSLIAARSSLAEQLVDFLKDQLPAVLRAAVTVVGSLALLAWTDGWLVLCCLALVGPAALTGRRYARRTTVLNARLHDEMERQVGVIQGGAADEVVAHYRRLAGWRVRLSDLEALNVGFLQTWSLALIAAALARTCLKAGADAGLITTVLGHVGMYVQGLIYLPTLVEQYGRLRDIALRVGGESEGCPEG
jgi:hypothetical protein